MQPDSAAGPLAGVTVIELAGIGPGPFAVMMLADMGATVIRIDRFSGTLIPVPGPNAVAVLDRGRRSIAIDLKHPGGAEIVKKLIESADVFVEGFRPGVAEKLAIGPADLQAVNPRLIYGRMTGFGQTGPMASTAGHDLNYIAMSGALGAIGRSDQPPTPPLSLVGDFGGGGLMLAYGVVCALFRRHTTGRGQVVDASIVDGAATLMAPYYGWSSIGGWSDERGTNIIDSGAPFYDSYQTSDGGWIAVAALEPHFYRNFVEILGLDSATLPAQHDRDRWPDLRSLFTETIARRTRDEWEKAFDGVDACVTPVLRLGEVPHSEHAVARGSFVTVGGLVQPVPSPRFSDSATRVGAPGPRAGSHTRDILAEAGYSDERIDQMLADAVVARADSNRGR